MCFEGRFHKHIAKTWARKKSNERSGPNANFPQTIGPYFTVVTSFIVSPFGHISDGILAITFSVVPGGSLVVEVDVVIGDG